MKLLAIPVLVRNLYLTLCGLVCNGVTSKFHLFPARKSFGVHPLGSFPPEQPTYRYDNTNVPQNASIALRKILNEKN